MWPRPQVLFQVKRVTYKTNRLRLSTETKTGFVNTSAPDGEQSDPTDHPTKHSAARTA